MATDPRPQSSSSFRDGKDRFVYDEGKKAAAKAEFFTVPPENSFLGGATYRDKLSGALRYLGADDRGINFVLGNPRADNIVDNVGLVDLFPPTAIPLAVQEGSRSMDQGRYIEGTLDLGLSALEMAPGAKLLTKPVGDFLKSIGSKISSFKDNLGALSDIGRKTEPDELIETATENMTSGQRYALRNEEIKRLDKARKVQEVAPAVNRRDFLTQAGTAAVAAPIVAGALGDLPVGKIIDDVIPSPNLPVAKVAGKVVKNVGQPSRAETINELMDLTDFGTDIQYGNGTIKESVAKFSSEINKAKKYFKLKKKTVDADELDMLSPNNEMSERLDEIQTEFGYSDDQMIKFIEEANSATKKNEKVWGKYLSSSEGDPDIGKSLGLGDESEGWQNWSEEDLWEKLYGSNDQDITGGIIGGKAE